MFKHGYHSGVPTADPRPGGEGVSGSRIGDQTVFPRANRNSERYETQSGVAGEKRATSQETIG